VSGYFISGEARQSVVDDHQIDCVSGESPVGLFVVFGRETAVTFISEYQCKS
jgi:hypothetical protein